MSKCFFTLTLFFCFTFAISQNFVSINGKIIDDNTKLPLESATVYLTSKKDSTVIDYTISGKNGNFSKLPVDIYLIILKWERFII